MGCAAKCFNVLQKITFPKPVLTEQAKPKLTAVQVSDAQTLKRTRLQEKSWANQVNCQFPLIFKYIMYLYTSYYKELIVEQQDWVFLRAFSLAQRQTSIAEIG